MIKNRQRLTLPHIIVVPSALAGLTSLFGMGRGDPRRYSHLKVLSLQLVLVVDFNFFDSIGKRVVCKIDVEFCSVNEQAHSDLFVVAPTVFHVVALKRSGN